MSKLIYDEKLKICKRGKKGIAVPINKRMTEIGELTAGTDIEIYRDADTGDFIIRIPVKNKPEQADFEKKDNEPVKTPEPVKQTADEEQPEYQDGLAYMAEDGATRSVEYPDKIDYLTENGDHFYRDKTTGIYHKYSPGDAEPPLEAFEK